MKPRDVFFAVVLAMVLAVIIDLGLSFCADTCWRWVSIPVNYDH